MSLSVNLRHFDMLSRCFKTAARRVPPQIEKMVLSSSTLDAAKPCKTFQAMQEREERANSKIENQEIIFFSQSSAIFFTKLLRPCSRCWRQHRDLLWLRHQGPGSFHRAAKASKLIWILKFEADWRRKKSTDCFGFASFFILYNIYIYIT